MTVCCRWQPRGLLPKAVMRGPSHESLPGFSWRCVTHLGSYVAPVGATRWAAWPIAGQPGHALLHGSTRVEQPVQQALCSVGLGQCLPHSSDLQRACVAAAPPNRSGGRAPRGSGCLRWRTSRRASSSSSTSVSSKWGQRLVGAGGGSEYIGRQRGAGSGREQGRDESPLTVMLRVSGVTTRAPASCTELENLGVSDRGARQCQQRAQALWEGVAGRRLGTRAGGDRCRTYSSGSAGHVCR